MSLNIIDSFMKVAHKFLQVLMRENDLLDSDNWEQVGDLVRQKQEIAHQYELLSQRLPVSLEWSEIADPQKEELVNIVNELADKLQENESKLSITLAAQERVLNLIVHSHKKKGTLNCYYTKAGSFRRNLLTVSMMSVDAKL